MVCSVPYLTKKMVLHDRYTMYLIFRYLFERYSVSFVSVSVVVECCMKAHRPNQHETIYKVRHPSLFDRFVFFRRRQPLLGSYHYCCCSGGALRKSPRNKPLLLRRRCDGCWLLFCCTLRRRRRRRRREDGFRISACSSERSLEDSSRESRMACASASALAISFALKPDSTSSCSRSRLERLRKSTDRRGPRVTSYSSSGNICVLRTFQQMVNGGPAVPPGLQPKMEACSRISTVS